MVKVTWSANSTEFRVRPDLGKKTRIDDFVPSSLGPTAERTGSKFLLLTECAPENISWGNFGISSRPQLVSLMYLYYFSIS